MHNNTRKIGKNWKRIKNTQTTQYKHSKELPFTTPLQSDLYIIYLYINTRIS